MALSGNIYANAAPARDGEAMEDLLARDDVRIERIVSAGHATPDGTWYDQDWDEFVILLAGEAGLHMADTDTTHTLRPGDWHLIPARRRHRVAWTSEDPPAIWLAVHLVS